MNEHAPQRIDDVEKAHAMALESNKDRSNAARARGIGKMILEEVQRGEDKWGRNAGDRIAMRAQEVQDDVFRTGSYITVADDMAPDELQKAGLSNRDPGAGYKQYQRFYDAREAVKNSGSAEKAVVNIDNWAAHLDIEAGKKEDAVTAEYDSKKD